MTLLRIAQPIFILLLTALSHSPKAQAESRYEKLLGYHIPGPIQVSRTVKKGDLLYISGTQKNRPLSASIHADSSRVLEISVDNKTVYRWRGIQVVGHRATALFAPENTLAAIRKARELGVHSVELDIRQTKDGELVVLHDDTVDRTTNGKGAVKDLTLMQVKALDAGSYFAKEYAGEKIPTLKEALLELGADLTPDIDFKDGSLNRFIQTMREMGYEGRYTFNGRAEDYSQLTSEGGLAQIRPRTLMGLFGIQKLLSLYSPKIIAVPEVQYDQSYVRSLHERGLKSFVNVIIYRSFEEYRLKRVTGSLPDYIQTDRPDFLVPYLKSQGLYYQ